MFAQRTALKIPIIPVFGVSMRARCQVGTDTDSNGIRQTLTSLLLSVCMCVILFFKPLLDL